MAGGGAGGGTESPDSYADDNQIGYTSTFTFNGRTYKNWKQYPLDGSSGKGWAKWMHNSGCGLTSAAIVLGGKNSSITPSYLYNYANGRAKQGSVNIRQYITDAGASYSVANSLDNVKQGLQSGKPVIMCLYGNATIDGVKWAGSSGHYIAILGISDDGSQVYVSNPGSNPSKKNGWMPLSKFSGSVYFGHTYIVSL